MALLRRGSQGPEVKEMQERLKMLGYSLDTDGIFGGGTEAAVKEFQLDKNLGVDGLAGSGTLSALRDATPNYQPPAAPPPPTPAAPAADGSLISRAQLKQIMPYASDSNLDKYIGPLNDCLKHYEINTHLRMAHFIAQVAHESGSFRYHEEIWPNPQLDANGVAHNGNSWQLRYEGRADLGNTQTGDGYKFRGRGLIQLTGRANYTKYAGDLGRNLTDGGNPDLVAEPELAVDAAGWFWNGRKLNNYADQDDVLTITKRINGGTNGLDDRKEFLAKAKSVLGIA